MDKGLQASGKRAMPSMPSLEPLKSSQQLGGIAGTDSWREEKAARVPRQHSPAVMSAHAGVAAGTEASAAAMALKLKRATVQAQTAPYAQSGNAAEMAAKAAGIASFIVARHPTSGPAKPVLSRSREAVPGQSTTSVSSRGAALSEGETAAAARSSKMVWTNHIRRDASTQKGNERSHVRVRADAHPTDTIQKDLSRAEEQLSSYNFLQEQKLTLDDAMPAPPRESVKQQMIALERGEKEQRHLHHDSWEASGLAVSGGKGAARAQKLVELPADMRGGLHIATAFKRTEQNRG
jgi:hypothetical protein